MKAKKPGPKQSAEDPKPSRSISAPGAGECHSAALKKATRRVSQFYDEALASVGLRATQMSILSHIFGLKNPSMGVLAEWLVLDRSALAHNLKPLERDGLIKIAVHAEDRRTRTVTLTKLGETKLNAAHKGWARAQQRFERTMSPEQIAALRSALSLLASTDFSQAD